MCILERSPSLGRWERAEATHQAAGEEAVAVYQNDEVGFSNNTRLFPLPSQLRKAGLQVKVSQSSKFTLLLSQASDTQDPFF